MPNRRVGMSFYNITANNNSTIVKPYQASKHKFSLIYTSSHARASHIYLLLPAFEDESEGSVADEVPRRVLIVQQGLKLPAARPVVVAVSHHWRGRLAGRRRALQERGRGAGNKRHIAAEGQRYPIHGRNGDRQPGKSYIPTWVAARATLRGRTVVGTRLPRVWDAKESTRPITCFPLLD